MFRNYFHIAIRTLWKHSVLSSINLIGLVIGFSACLLISLYIKYEASYDDFQPKGDRIARVISEFGFSGSDEPLKGNYTSTKVAPVLTRTFPDVSTAIKMRSNERTVRYEDEQVNEPNFMFADSTFFTMFYYDMVQGNPATALAGRYKVVLTESTAHRYFGDEDAVGKTLLIGSDQQPYDVTGVIKDYPTNSHLKFDFLASFSSLGLNQEETYFDANFTTYLLLNSSGDFSSLQTKLNDFMAQEVIAPDVTLKLILEPFNDVHLRSPYPGFVPNTSVSYLYSLAAVAFLIVVIACFTYINLSTARAVERAREVGVRKVIGAQRGQLFWQFIGESALICAVAFILSLGVAGLALPFFNALTQKTLSLGLLFQPSFLIAALVVVLAVSVVAGGYPAIVLAGFAPIRVLKGVFKNSGTARALQQWLIVFQFAISVFLIVATFVIQKQLYYVQHKSLGFDRSHLLQLPMVEKMYDNVPAFKSQLKTHPDVLHVSRCVRNPVFIMGGYSMRKPGANQEEIAITANPVDEDYVTTTGMEIIAGRDFTEQDTRDVSVDKREDAIHHYLLNERAVQLLGWTPEEAIGKRLLIGDRSGFIEGVIKDFHFKSLHQPIGPVVLFTEPWGRELLVKVSGHHMPQTIAFIENTWKAFVPYMPFDYSFLDDQYDRLYEAELQLGKVMNIFAFMAILLACLGLFGLSSYVVQQRVKEISIRKVLGASMGHLVTLLSGSFARLVVISIVIALPVAYLVMQQWLLDFAYRMTMPWWIFVLAALAAIFIAVLTVSVQSIRAAIANPAKNLKAE